MTNTTHQGFTLIELLITLAIVGILTTLSYTSVINHLQKARRVDALASLLQEQWLLAQCYGQNASYVAPCKGKPSYPHLSQQGFYLIDLIEITPETYQLQATAVAEQALDKCLSLAITNTNVRTIIGGADCW